MSVHNEDIAVIFEEIADLLDIKNDNPFRVRAYRNGAQTVRGLGRELADGVAEGEDLTTLPCIGKELAKKIEEILRTGTTKALKKLHKELPASLRELLKIPGLGPKRVKVLYEDLGIKNLKQLQRAAYRGRLKKLPGFSRKMERRILQTIASDLEKKKRFQRITVMPYTKALVDYLKQAPGVKKVVIAGSYRRGKETVGDLDILVTSAKGAAVMDTFSSYDEIDEILSQGPTRSTVILHCGLQVDLRLVEEHSFGAAMHYFTGCKTHNIQIRRLAQQKDLKINEYGVFKDDRHVAGKTEASVFKSVGLPFISPELREGRGEVEAALNNDLPSLVERSDLKGNLHTHTDATDGQASLIQMALAAKKRGYAYLAITDHSKRLSIVHGLNSRRLLKQIDEIDRINEQLRTIKILKGIEVDILKDGRLDLPNKVLSKLDLVIGAVHGYFTLSRKKQTNRILRAMDNRYFSILAHPTGRLLDERKPYDLDMERIIDKAKERGCFLELNSQPKRLDLTDIYCRMAKEAGVLVSISSDAHSENDLDNLQFGIAQARRGWLEKSDVLNTRSLDELNRLLKQTMG